MLQGNSEKTAASKGFSCIKQLVYHLGPPPVAKISFPKRGPDREKEQLPAQRLLNSGSTSMEERSKLQSREGSYCTKEMNQKGGTRKEKKQAKNCLKEKSNIFH